MFRFYSLSVGNFAFVNAQAEATLGIGTGPRFENYRSALLPVIRERNQRAIVALLALRQLHHHGLLTDRKSAPNATYLTTFSKSMCDPPETAKFPRHLADGPIK
jgi:hypothetical protein